MQALKPLDIPLIGKNLIQASAGTGKTWTISLLYLRLIIEQQLTVDQLLVVTYTRAATEELRERIRARLKAAVDAYENPALAKNEYQELLDLCPADELRLWNLRRALLGFDEAAVFTIHGFCQRALQEHAFEVGLPFDSELVQDEADIQLALADQFWQQRLLKPDALGQLVLETTPITPDSLLADVKDFIGKPYLHTIRQEPLQEHDLLQAQEQYQQQLTQVRLIWQEQHQEILALLKPEVMNQASYKPAQLETTVTLLKALFIGQWDKASLDKLAKFTPAQLSAKTKKGQQTPEHDFFNAMEPLLDQLYLLLDIQEIALQQLRLDLLDWLREKLPERKRQAGLLAFDDLLVNLQEALEQRPSLADLLAKRYPVALIDEFQDTDPVQFTIFEHIYRESEGRLFYVGDPKQAIYSFRGADINTYLHAADTVLPGQQFTLDRNFRSQPRLIDAFNHLYSFADDPFRNQQRIGYEVVSPGGVVADELQCQPELAPLRIWDWDKLDAEDGVPAVVEQVATAVANDIASLLQQGQRGEVCLAGEAIVSGDIAVLVRSHRQGRIIKQALQRCGIASVQKSPVGIFATPEAQELRILLAAIAEPGNLGKVRRALVTEVSGVSAEELLAMDEQPELLERALEDFYDLHRLWQSQGFMPMLRDWLQRNKVYQRLLAQVDGERRMTNLLHLGELIHAETRERWGGMQAIIRWLQRHAEQAGADEEHQLRLESDENLVQIVTIHKSKGLQYPIVYCPFLWNEPDMSSTRQWFVWYDPEDEISCLQAGNEQLEHAREMQRAEVMSENLRLLYVALTRAQYHCTVVVASGDIPRFNYRSALSWTLFGHLSEAERILLGKKQGKNKIFPEERQQLMQQQLGLLADSSNGSIAWETLPAVTEPLIYQPDNQLNELDARNFQHAIPPILRVGSFSGLTAGQHDERPDYDTSIQLAQSTAWQTQQDSFPGGTQAGVCLHKMLERLDFTQTIAGQREEVIERSLQEHGFEARWAGAAEKLVLATVQTPLLADEDLQLVKIDKKQRLDEMEFYFPVQQLRLKKLQEILLIALPDDWFAIRAAVKRLAFTDLKGFMKGFIDLIFRYEDKYYIVDYKSNWLGEQAEDYAPGKLMQAMADTHYYLQYLIYSIALHRYLRQRLGADYQWDTHVGGVFYLFMRGMESEGEFNENGRNGVFFDKPEAELIMALDQLMEIGLS